MHTPYSSTTTRVVVICILVVCILRRTRITLGVLSYKKEYAHTLLVFVEYIMYCWLYEYNMHTTS